MATWFQLAWLTFTDVHPSQARHQCALEVWFENDFWVGQLIAIMLCLRALFKEMAVSRSQRGTPALPDPSWGQQFLSWPVNILNLHKRACGLERPNTAKQLDQLRGRCCSSLSFSGSMCLPGPGGNCSMVEPTGRAERLNGPLLPLQWPSWQSSFSLPVEDRSNRRGECEGRGTKGARGRRKAGSCDWPIHTRERGRDRMTNPLKVRIRPWMKVSGGKETGWRGSWLPCEPTGSHKWGKGEGWGNPLPP